MDDLSNTQNIQNTQKTTAPKNSTIITTDNSRQNVKEIDSLKEKFKSQKYNIIVNE